MALPTIVQLIDGIETRLQTITGLRTTEYVPDSPVFPAGIVGVPPWDRETMRKGLFSFEATVTILVSANYDRSGQRQLAGYADFTGSGSVIVAIEGDPTLGLSGVDCKVLRFRPLGVEEVNAYRAFGGEFALKLHATAT